MIDFPHLQSTAIAPAARGVRRATVWLILLAGLLLACPVSGEQQGGPSRETVYASDFNQNADGWGKSLPRVKVGKDNASALGPLARDAIRRSLRSLPEHKALVVHVDLELRGPWTGQAGGGWSLSVSDAPAGVKTSFSIAPSDEPGPPQAFPLSGARGHFPANTAASETGKADANATAVYELVYLFAHTEDHAEITLVGSPDARNAQWLVRSVRVEALSDLYQPDDSELAASWNALAASDKPALAMAAMARLTGGGAGARKFLTARLGGDLDADKAAALVKQLSHRDWRKREQASRSLTALGSPVEGVLRTALRRTDSPEARARIREILDDLRGLPLEEKEALRHARAIEALRLQGIDALASLGEIASSSPYEQTKAFATQAISVNLRSEVQQLRADVTGHLMDRKWNAAEASCRKLLEHLQPVEDAGLPWVARVVKMYAELLDALEKASALQADLKKDPSQENALRLARLHLLRLGNPLSPAAVQADRTPEHWRTGLVLARKDSRDVEQSLTYSGWLTQIHYEARGLGRSLLLERAEKELTGLPDRGKLTGAQQARAQALAQKVLMAKASLDSGVGWGNALAQVEIKKHARRGTWKSASVGMKLSASDFGLLAIPLRPRGSYVLKVQFSRTKGTEGIFIGLPVGDRRCNLNLDGWGGRASGLEWIDRRQANHNPTTTKLDIANNQVHTVTVRMFVDDDKVSVSASLDGKGFLQWKGKASQLSTSGVWGLKGDDALAVGAHQCDIIFHRVEIRNVGPAGRRQSPSPAD